MNVNQIETNDNQNRNGCYISVLLFFLVETILVYYLGKKQLLIFFNEEVVLQYSIIYDWSSRLEILRICAISFTHRFARSSKIDPYFQKVLWIRPISFTDQFAHPRHLVSRCLMQFVRFTCDVTTSWLQNKQERDMLR